ncbi:putative E3 ubiquitin ligase [Phytophthora cinnamomi]|uniref:putative E3 ubiquitin ligase n=1 Tax=Phytophthora cinnamomi TaxID=4785 RepID=UPI00355993EB|nr:putative E3 ubiquitin ligase [Phytophthora cinnamomi]
MTGADRSETEMEAGLSLLHMMHPPASSPAAAGELRAVSETGDALHASLMKVVAKQASDELSLPRIAAAKKVQQRSGHMIALSHELTLEELRPHFDKPIVEVAREFGICTTFLKKMCRRCGIKRWPHRQIRSLTRTIQMLEQVEAVATNPQEKERYTLQIEELREKQRAVMEDPDAHLNLKRSKRYAPPKGAVKGGATVATVAGQESAASAQPVTTPLTDLAAIPPNVDNLSALAVAVESLSSTSDSSKGSCMAPGSLPLGVQIPAAEISVPASLTTPMHASVSHYASSPSARLSPSNRKVKLAKAGVDAEHRLRSTSIGSLQD